MRRIQIKQIVQYFLISLLLLCPFSNVIAQNDNPRDTFSINGTVLGTSAGMVMLNYFRGSEWTGDSAEIREGKFKFSGSVASPCQANLYLKKKKNQQLNFYLESNEITIALNPDSIELSNVSGSLSNVDFDSVKALMAPYYVSLGALKTLSQYARDNHLNRAKENIDTIYALLAIAQRKAITAYALTHPDSYAIADRVFINFTNDQTELPLLKSIYNNFAPQIKKSVGGKSIEDLIKGIERVQIGNDAPDFSLPDDKGKEVQFSTFKGKYILLDFWASWCVPCRAESPSLVSAFQKYNDKNFIIVSISLDTEKDQWMKAIKDDQFTWPQLSSLKGYMENGVRQLYNVQGIPDNFLISPDGKIIARGLRGENLEKELSRSLN